jgi:hypothetical protein
LIDEEENPVANFGFELIFRTWNGAADAIGGKPIGSGVRLKIWRALFRTGRQRQKTAACRCQLKPR